MKDLVKCPKLKKTTVSNRDQFISEPINLNDTLSFTLFNKIQSKREEWQSLVPDNIFFSIPFLSLIESDPPVGITPFYAIVKSSGKSIAVLSLQLKQVDLAESMNMAEFERKSVFQKLTYAVRNFATKFAKFNTLICGNVLLTGEYGFHFSDQTILYKDQFAIVEQVLDKICKVFPQYGYKAGPILLKDYYKDKELSLNNMTNSTYTEFAVQPNMMLNMNASWKSFDDYMAALKSKYRVRVKRAFKKLGDDVEKRELYLDDIKKYRQRIYDLYKETASDADFNLFTLPFNYFISLKEYLGDKIKIVGYFAGEEMIGYYTILFNTEYMEAHYLGYDKSKNAARQIYLNMLLDLIKEGVDNKVDKIQFARTALEIKSSVGALPYDMLCYLKHTTSWKNAILPKLLNFMVPLKEWKPRTPFK